MKEIVKRVVVLCAFLLLVGPAAIVQADWEPGEPNKWVQFPDLTNLGIDIRVDDSDGIQRTLADDFKCTKTGLITDVHLWGSWKYDDKGEIQVIHLSIHDDNPRGVNGYSEPNTLLWEKDFFPGDFTERLYHQSDPGEYWWDPVNGDPIQNGDTQIWQINIPIDPCDAFEQQGTTDEPIIYWLDVRVKVMPELSGEFGWKTRRWPNHYNDDAVFDDGDAAAPAWQELKYPPGHPYEYEDPCSIDLAFVITTQEEPPPPSKPLVEHSKWSQPPIEMYPNEPNITFCGWDQVSFTQDPTAQWTVVADDFRCIGSMPVTSIHWWGSYYGWEGHGLPAQQPIAWRIGFWSNVPEGVVGYSYPERLLWQVEVDAARVTIEEVGRDYFPIHPPDTCFQYNVQLDTAEWFWQEEYLGPDMVDNVFWISIAAIYDDTTVPNNPWGWKTRPWHWMDDAVTIDIFGDMIPGTPGTVLTPSQIEPLKYEGESFDAAYELDTDPCYIKWEQYYTGIRHWPHYEDEESMAIEAAGTPELQINRLVADDWPCEQHTPVTAIAWWGSYIGYRYQACSGTVVAPPRQPDYFLLNIWTDVPADPCTGAFSHPEQIIWEYRAYPHEYDEVLVGFDKFPHDPDPEPYRLEPVFRYSLRLPQTEWFRQPTESAVFWLSIVAVYVDADPQFPWGWTNHEHMYNDDAVAGYKLPDGTWQWNELFDQTGVSEDMSFILFQEPGCFPSSYSTYFDWLTYGKPSCWCNSTAGGTGDYQCDGDADLTTQGVITKYRVSGNDLSLIIADWKKKFSDNPNPCADVDHKQQGIITKYRVSGNDLSVVITNWKKKDSNLPGDCPRPE